MSEHESEKKVVAVVNGAAWKDFYVILDSLNEQLTAWAGKHDLPLSIMVGAAWALGSTIDHFADLCDCDDCLAVQSTFVDEVMDRVVHAENQTSKAVH